MCRKRRNEEVNFAKIKSVLTVGIITLILTLSAAAKGKHLIMLSGQSNMERFEHDKYFIPGIEGQFGAENVIVVKDSKGGQPISMW
mgnify:CR=1 FL=1